MNSLRRNFLAKIFALLTGVIFLNTSFFMAELSLLKVHNHKLLENIVKLVSNSGLEEERDGDSENDTTGKEVDVLICQVQVYHQTQFSIATKVIDMQEDHYPHANYSQTFSPPPDLTHLS